MVLTFSCFSRHSDNFCVPILDSGTRLNGPSLCWNETSGVVHLPNWSTSYSCCSFLSQILGRAPRWLLSGSNLWSGRCCTYRYHLANWCSASCELPDIMIKTGLSAWLGSHRNRYFAAVSDSGLDWWHRFLPLWLSLREATMLCCSALLGYGSISYH